MNNKVVKKRAEKKEIIIKYKIKLNETPEREKIKDLKNKNKQNFLE